MSEANRPECRPVDAPPWHPRKPETFELSADFSTSGNPADGWSYGWSGTLGGPLQLYPLTHQPYAGIIAWYDPVPGNEPNIPKSQPIGRRATAIG
jgi:hypothetical protein